MGSQANCVSFTALVNEVIPVIGVRSLGAGLSGKQSNLVVIYGGRTEENFRLKLIDPLGKRLADFGFNVYCFDFRSNLDASRFCEFGLYDRLEDAREVTRWVLEIEKAPLSLMGVSMGGPLAVAIASELGDKIENLFLTAPAAYSRKVMNPEVKFGQQFKDILNEPESWKETDSFEEAKQVGANTLIFQFGDDKKVPKQIPIEYWRNIGARANRGQNIRLRTFDGNHEGMYTDPERHEKIIDEMRIFLALSSLTPATQAVN